jgi:hypothetical protein
MLQQRLSRSCRSMALCIIKKDASGTSKQHGSSSGLLPKKREGSYMRGRRVRPLTLSVGTILSICKDVALP